MNYSIITFSALLLSLFSAANANCSVCRNPNLFISNHIYNHQLQDDRLGPQTTWNCDQLEDRGLSGGFNSAQCSSAQDIAIRYCGCNVAGYTPNVVVDTTPVCEFCPGGNTNTPDKLVNTIAGALTCNELIDGGRGGFWPVSICASFKNDGVSQQCCPISAAPPAGGGGLGLVGCFSGENMVNVENQGPTRMEDVKIGDMLSVGSGKFSRVYSFGHIEADAKTDYLQIHADDLAAPLEITKEHMLFVEQKGAVPASMVAVGDKVVLADGTTSVSKISSVTRVGAYAPFTESGTLIVSDVLSSSFISVVEGSSSLTVGDVEVASLHWLAHAFEAPHRMVCKLSPTFCDNETYTSGGISHWVDMPLKASIWLMSQGAVVQSLLSVGVLAVCATFYLVESLFNNSTVLTIMLALVYFTRKRGTKSA